MDSKLTVSQRVIYPLGVLAAAVLLVGSFLGWLDGTCQRKRDAVAGHMAAIAAEHDAADGVGYSEAGRLSIREHALALREVVLCPERPPPFRR